MVKRIMPVNMANVTSKSKSVNKFQFLECDLIN